MVDQSRRDQLLIKAAHLFSKKGYHATTMKDIAAELEILPGSLYHHIDSKESLLLEIMELCIQALLKQVRPVVASDLSPIEKIREIVCIHIKMILSHPDMLTVFLHEMKSIPKEKRLQQIELRAEYNYLLKRVIEEGVASGDFRPLHPGMASFAILGMLNWLYTWYRSTGSLTPTEITNEYLAFVMHGLIKNDS
ncbi:MAG: TetR/AcrR family transcriptional regulator [Ardenticatenaceae bacterium]